MATIITKFSSTASAVPTASDLVQGELAVNTADKRLFTEDSGASIIEIGTNPTSITTGNITASGTLGVTGATTLSDNLTMSDGRLQITNSSFNLKSFEVIGSGNTTSSAVYLSADNLTTGKALEVISAGTDASSRNLVRLANTSTLATGTTVLQIDQSSSGNALSVSGNSLFTGNITVTGNATISGNLTFGDADTDSISLNADVDSHILPNTDDTYDLGSTSKQWRNLYINGTANIDSLVADTADINGGTIDGAIIGGSSAAAITGTSITGTSFVSSGNMTFGDNDKAIFGAGSDLEIYHDGTDSIINDNGTGSLKLQLGGSTKLETTMLGIDVTGSVTTDGLVTSDDIYFGSSKAIFGINAIEIYADVTYGHIDLSNPLFIETDSGISIFTSTLENIANFNANGNVNLWYDGSKKFETTSTGIDVTGTVTADELIINAAGGQDLTDIEINRNSTGSYPVGISMLDTGGTRGARIESSLNSINYLAASNGTTNYSGVAAHRFYSSGTLRMNIDGQTGDISFYEDTGTTAKFFWDASTERLGIGNSSPTTALDVTGSVVADGLDIGNINIGDATNTIASTASLLFDIDSNDNQSTAVFKITTNNQTKNLFNMEENGDISFYENTGTTAKLFWDASAESLGIGTTSPQYLGHFVDGDVAIVDSDATNNAEKQSLLFGGASGESAGLAGITGYRGASASAGELIFKTNQGSGITEAMRIDSSGNLLVGKTSTDNTTNGFVLDANGTFNVVRSSEYLMRLNRTTTDGEILRFQKDGTTVGSIGSASSTTYIAGDASGIRLGSTAFMPSTTAGANKDDAVDLGHSSVRFKDIYATNGTIQTSDANEKQDIEELSDAEQRVAVAAKGLLRKFRWKSAVEEKGDDARIHFGIIAQDLQAAFTAEGLDAGRYAMFIHSTWTDEETGEERSRMGVRYSELLAFIIAAI